MEQKGYDFFQTAVEGADPFMTTRTERFAFVIGSGGKGQTYLFWKGDDLFQLPVSYWSELGWVNSPGYRDGTANFSRPIIPRCLECHGTYFEQIPPPSNRYSKTGFTVGITCEKCHGPGREHVQTFSAKSTSECEFGHHRSGAIFTRAPNGSLRLVSRGSWFSSSPHFRIFQAKLWINTWHCRNPTHRLPWMFTAAKSKCWSEANAFRSPA